MFDPSPVNPQGLKWEEWLQVAWVGNEGKSFDDVFGTKKSVEQWLLWRKAWREGNDPSDHNK